MTAPLFIGSEIYRHSSYGRRHPLRVPRVSTVMDFCAALGWLADGQYLDSPMASVDQLSRFHRPDYLAALIAAERTGRASPEDKARFNIGLNGNPIFPEIFSRPATAAGASILGAARIIKGGVVYSPAGGTHHGRPDRASGFCYLNDPVLAILTLLDAGIDRIAYVDVDAHHGDGVQDAFAHDDRVLTVSVHEGNRWPFTGPVEDRAGGFARNIPVPRDFNDTEMAFVMEEAILPLLAAFAPQAIVLQCGADALAEDPLSKLTLSNNALWQVVARLRPLTDRFLVLGGGGYNPWSVARCWTGVWATLNGLDIPDRLPPQAETILRQITWSHSQGRNPPDHWFTTLRDAPRAGEVREEVRSVVGRHFR